MSDNVSIQSQESHKHEENKAKIRVALTSVFAALFLTVTKLGVGLATNSLGILAEALHSALDMVAAIITLAAVYFSKNPADLDHNFGHGKVENFSALVETLILIITCGWIIFEAVQRFLHPIIPDVNIYSFAVILLAIFIDYERSRMLFRVAKRTRSQALQADALHFSTDIMSSSVVIIGLIFVTIGFPLGDAIAALAVAIIVIWISVRLGQATINALMDKVPFEQYEMITNFCKQEYPEYHLKRLRLRESGPSFLGDLTLIIPADMPVNDFHSVSEEMHRQLVNLIPNLDLMISAHPSEENGYFDEMNVFTIQKVMNSIKLPNGIKQRTHNVTLYKNDNHNAIDLDLELPNELSLSEAYSQLTYFQEEIQKKIPKVQKIHIHLEPMLRTKKYFKTTSTDRDDIEGQIRSLINTISEIKGIKDLELNDHKGRLIIHLGILLDGSKSLEEAHAVTYLIESKIFQSINNIDKVFTHIEPK